MAKAKATQKTQESNFNLQSLNNKWVIGAGATAALATAPFVAGVTALTVGTAAMATAASAAVVGLGYGVAQVAPKAYAQVKAYFATPEADSIAKRSHPRAAKGQANKPAAKNDSAKPGEGFFANVKFYANSAANTVKSYASSAYNTTKSYTIRAYNATKSYASSAYTTVKSYAASAYASLKSLFTKAVEKEQEVQKVVTSAVASGLKTAHDAGVSALNAGSKFLGFSNHKEAAKKPATAEVIARRLKRDGIDLNNIITDAPKKKGARA